MKATFSVYGNPYLVASDRANAPHTIGLDHNPEHSQHEAQEGDEMELKYLKRLLERMQIYCTVLPVLGFNSARYDLNLIKSKLFKYINIEKPGTYVVKRANSYQCIFTDHFKILDITSYLAAGVSYVQFLKAYGVQEEKGFFPYEWFYSFEKLDFPELPPYEAFYSSLRSHNTLDPYDTGEGQKNYALIKSVWERNNMKTFRDFLKYCDNADVTGFVTAVERMLEYYFSQGIDLFKTTISLPNLARHRLFQCTENTGIVFPLFDKKTQDIYRIVQQNIVGGPSIVFKREAKAGETFVRNNPNVVGQRILGHDTNGLYAYCIGRPMLTGLFVDRRREQEFMGEFSGKYVDMYFWLDFVAETGNINIQHKLNSGCEKQIGPYKVDGFCSETNTVYEYNGCWYHFCGDCQRASSVQRVQKLQMSRRERTVARRRYFERGGYCVVEMKKCHYKSHIEPQTIHIRNRYLPAFYSLNPGKVTEREIVEAVLSERLFGMIECDISVPNPWRMNDDENSRKSFFESNCAASQASVDEQVAQEEEDFSTAEDEEEGKCFSAQ